MSSEAFMFNVMKIQYDKWNKLTQTTFPPSLSAAGLSFCSIIILPATFMINELASYPSTDVLKVATKGANRHYFHKFFQNSTTAKRFISK